MLECGGVARSKATAINCIFASQEQWQSKQRVQRCKLEKPCDGVAGDACTINQPSSGRVACAPRTFTRQCPFAANGHNDVLYRSTMVCFSRDSVQGVSRMGRVSCSACSAITTVLHGFKQAELLLGCLKDAGAAMRGNLSGKLSTRRTEALGSSSSDASELGKKCDRLFHVLESIFAQLLSRGTARLTSPEVESSKK